MSWGFFFVGSCRDSKIPESCRRAEDCSAAFEWLIHEGALARCSEVRYKVGPKNSYKWSYGAPILTQPMAKL